MRYNLKSYPMIFYKFYDSFHLIKNFFLNKRYPIKRKTEKLSCSPFFIIGSGRSGNTLLRAVLCNHSEISIPPESYVLSNIVRKYQTFNFLNWKELIKLIVAEFESHEQFYTWEINLEKVYKILLNLDEKEKSLAKIIDVIYSYYSKEKFGSFNLWGDKTPLNTLNLSWIDRVFDAKYIHIVRDGRDVVNSYLNMGRYNTIEDASERWKQSIELARKFGAGLDKDAYFELKYEDFVSQPEKKVRKVCNFLDVNFEEGMLNHRNKVNELGDTDKLSHHKNLKKPINTNSVGKWEKGLNETQKNKVNKLLSDNLFELGYK